MAEARLVVFNADPEGKLQDTELRKVDREQTVIFLLASGLRHVKILAEDRQLFFYFKRDESEKISSLLLSGNAVLVDIHEVFKATETWRNALVTMKTLRAEANENKRKFLPE